MTSKLDIEQVCGFIPAKGSSNRVPSKNKQEVLGVPLYLWAARNLSQCLNPKNIYIDSDDDEILETAQEAGFQALKRPAELATNATDGNALMRWHAENCDTPYLVQHLPPMLFLSKETLESCVNIFEGNDFDSCLVGYRSQHYYWKNENTPEYNLKSVPNSVDLGSKIVEGMGLYCIAKDTFLQEQTRIGIKAKFVELPKIEQLDIDYPDDLELARTLAAGLPQSSGYLSGLGGIRRKLKKSNIKLLVCDVDGVLTDGKMHWSAEGNNVKIFHNKDGLTLKRLAKRGIDSIFLSAGPAQDVLSHRAKHLGIQGAFASVADKHSWLSNYLKEQKLEWTEVCYVGDEEPDLKCVETAGLSFCPADASDKIKKIATQVLSKKGGDGCLVEIEEWI